MIYPISTAYGGPSDGTIHFSAYGGAAPYMQGFSNVPANQQTASNPYGVGIQDLSQSTSNSTSGTGGGGMPAYPTAPSLNQFNYSNDATQYPTYMRNLGENNAQQAFQTQVNMGIREGSAGQGYMHALNDRNNARLSYMGQAGKEQLGVENQQRSAQENYQDQLLKKYAYDIGLRGQDIEAFIAQQRLAAQSSQILRTGGGSSGGGRISSGGGGGSVGTTRTLEGDLRKDFPNSPFYDANGKFIQGDGMGSWGGDGYSGAMSGARL